MNKKVKKSFQELPNEYLLNNGECCGNGCKNCVYFPKASKGSKKLFKPIDFVRCAPSCSIKTMQEGLCNCYLEFIESSS